ncbi:hypothetical protein K438DRAFT_1998513 [Mycena galopus ATCC 62051]|nr:hypothetical protein K438DRAFT_1998513 [Mycena galopus ATCC 62051]
MSVSRDTSTAPGTNHFTPKAVMFSPRHWTDVILSDIRVLFWLVVLAAAICMYGVSSVFVVYVQPYLWVNRWLVLITFLQHTDPLLPHYCAPQFTFPHGALSTLDRNLLSDLGSIMARIVVWKTKTLPTIRDFAFINAAGIICCHTFGLPCVDHRRVVHDLAAVQMGAGPFLLEPQADADVTVAVAALAPMIIG